MGIIAEVKCARCDRKYSGLRSRCPYCGARRIGRGKYSEQSDDNKGKMLIGILIMAVLVVAVVVLLLTTKPPEGDAVDTGPVIDAGESNSGLPDDSDTSELLNNTPVTSPSEDINTESPTDSHVSIAPSITSVTITYIGGKRTEFTCNVNEKVPLKIKIEPIGVEAEIIWESSNSDVFDIIDMDESGINATVIGLSPGNEKLTVKVGDVTETCVVRVVR